jgi:hypothetical protein
MRDGTAALRLRVGRYGAPAAVGRGRRGRQHVSAIQGSRRRAERTNAAQGWPRPCARRSAARDVQGASTHEAPCTPVMALSAHSSDAQPFCRRCPLLQPLQGVEFLQTRCNRPLGMMTPIVIVGERSRPSALRHLTRESMRPPCGPPTVRSLAASPPASEGKRNVAGRSDTSSARSQTPHVLPCRLSRVSSTLRPALRKVNNTPTHGCEMRRDISTPTTALAVRT